MKLSARLRNRSIEQLRSTIVCQALTIERLERENKLVRQVAETLAADVRKLSTPELGTDAAIQVAFWREKAEQLLEDLKVLQNPTWFNR